MKEEIVTKSAFAAIAGSRVSQLIADGRISGDELVGRGHHAKVNVDVALRQLKQNLYI